MVAISIIAGTFYYTSPTQQWERQLKLYQGQINSYSGDIQNLENSIIDRLKNSSRFLIQ